MSAYRDKVALVTGGASGIGRALGAALASRGARVILADLDGARAAEAAQALGGGARAAEVNVADPGAVQRLVDETVQRDGRIDYLFNNAGVGLAGEVQDMTLADWRRMVDVNLWGVIHGVAAAYPHMVRQGSGHIVNTSSGAGLSPRPGMTAYAAVKHAVVGLSTSLRAEAAALGVRVSVVCPGYIATGIMKASSYKNLDAEALAAGIPIRPVSAEECARQVLGGVARNRAVITVGKSAWLEWFLFRLFPGLSIRASEIRIRKMRQHRT